jgi:hypothetical protein
MREMHEGLGWNKRVQDGRTMFTHNGVLFTFSARQYLIPDLGKGIGIAVITNTGLALAPVDSDSIAQALIAIVEGRMPEASEPTGFLVDLIITIFSVLTIFWGWLTVRRSRRWANLRSNRSVWRNAVVLLPYLVPLVVVSSYPALIGVGAGGRDISWIQSLYVSTLLFAWLCLSAMMSLLVLAHRIAHLRGICIRRDGGAPRPKPHPFLLDRS